MPTWGRQEQLILSVGSCSTTQGHSLATFCLDSLLAVLDPWCEPVSSSTVSQARLGGSWGLLSLGCS